MIKKRTFGAVLLLMLLVSMGLTACSSSPAQGSTSVTTPNLTPTAPSDAPSEPVNTPETPIALSGSVYVYMPSPAGLADKLAAGFEALTGVKVEQFQGTTGEILARLEAEAANPIADVVILASWADGLSMKAKDQLLSYAPVGSDKVHAGWKEHHFRHKCVRCRRYLQHNPFPDALS